MGCGACGQARQQFVMAARRFNMPAAVAAAARGAHIMVDKARGVDVDAKYGAKPPVAKATPYRRPQDPERST